MAKGMSSRNREFERNKTMAMDVKDYERREKLAHLRLTPQEKLFCEIYVTTMDWKVAMLEAGYAMQDTGETGHDTKHNYNHFERLTGRVDIQNYILLLKESVVSRLGFSLDDVIEEYRRLAFAKMSDFYTWSDKGIKRLKSMDQLTEAQRAQVMEISETTGKLGTTVKIKLFPKQAALDKLYEIMKDLQEQREKKTSEHRSLIVDRTQVNVFLQDPVKRRAIEHVAEGLFRRRIFLTASDREREGFERQLEKITQQYQEATSEGAGRRGFIEHIPIDERPEDRDSGRDPRLGEGAPQEGDAGTMDQGVPEIEGGAHSAGDQEQGWREGSEVGEGDEAADDDGDSRYPDIDGL